MNAAPHRPRRAAAGALLAALALTFAGCATLGARSDAPTAATTTAGTPAAPRTAAPQAKANPDAPEAVRRWAAVNRSLGDALRGARSSCDAVARTLDDWTHAHAAEFREATAAMDAWEKTVSRSEARRHHERVERDIDARIQAGVRCDGHAGAHAAFERFFDAVGFSSEG